MKTCKHCNKTIDEKNINFLFTVALSQQKEKNPNSEEFYQFMYHALCDAKDISFCICKEGKEEREKMIAEAEKYLTSEENNHEIKLKELGFDFAQNQDVLYSINEKSFDKAHLLMSLKETKFKTEKMQNLKFDYIRSSDTLNKEFNRGKYYNNYNFLFVDLDYIDLDKKDRRKMFSDIAEIIIERRSNLKKTFLLLPKEVHKSDFEQIMSKEMFQNETNVISKFSNTIETFKEKEISTIFDEDTNKVKTISASLYSSLDVENLEFVDDDE